MLCPLVVCRISLPFMSHLFSYVQSCGQMLPFPCLISRMCVHCRVALEAAAASPAAADLAARWLTSEPLTPKSEEPNEDVGSSVGSETQLARSHVASLVCIVCHTGQACWLAVSQEDKLRPAHYQALLDTFACDALFCQDKPTGLRQVQYLSHIWCSNLHSVVALCFL